MTLVQARRQTTAPRELRLPVVELVVRDEDVRRPGWLQAQLDDVLRVRPDRVVVDLAACPSLDSAALRSLLDVHCELRRVGGTLVLRGAGPRVVRVIGLAGLGGVFDLEGAVPLLDGALPA